MKVCVIGDSISEYMDKRVVANAMKSSLRVAKAYSTMKDSSENEAKEETKYPEQGFVDIIESELNKDATDILLIQAGSEDISNLKTAGDPMKFGEYFKQQTIISATNLFTAVSNALVTHPTLTKAVIMNLTPRYDPVDVDPHGIKAALCRLYNDTLVQLCLSSPLKDKIHIGTHSLECSGAVKDARYRLGNRYDGLHFYGPSGRKAYTESVLQILRSAAMLKRSPPRYFRHFYESQTKSASFTETLYICPTQDTDYLRDKDIRRNGKHYGYKSNVPTKNRFQAFNSKNC